MKNSDIFTELEILKIELLVLKIPSVKREVLFARIVAIKR